MTRLERKIITSIPIAFILNKSKHWYLPGFEGVPLYDVVRFFYRQVKTVGLTERASAIAYNFIMAIPPSFLFLFTLIPNLPFIKKGKYLNSFHSSLKISSPPKGTTEPSLLLLIKLFFKRLFLVCCHSVYCWHFFLPAMP